MTLLDCVASRLMASLDLVIIELLLFGFLLHLVENKAWSEPRAQKSFLCITVNAHS